MLTSRLSRKGFTLVELSIVLVIIGLIIGGVLAGQQVIQNAEVTNAVNAIQAYEAQFQTYEQNYGAMPGNDSQEQVRFPNANLPGHGTGNGNLQGAFDSAAQTDESVLLWGALRAAGLVKNQVPATAQPINPFNGIYGFQNGAFNGALTGTVLCMSNVPGSAALAIDSRLDDGSSAAGSMQAMVYAAAAGSAVTGTVVANPPGYTSGTTYTLCMQMQH